ncbi:MAG: hypothetical protein AB8G18_01540 [Gammaproteobacteria bacterium]
MHTHLPQGIRVEEGTNQEQAIQGVETRPTVVLGACQRGPLNTPVLVRSFSEFVRWFGQVTDELPLPHAVRLFFANGGREALIVRVARNAQHAYMDLPGDGGELRLWSRNPGEHDYLRAAVDYDGIDPVDDDCFNLTLQRLAEPGTEHVVDQEIFRNVSARNDHPNFLPHILAGSHLVRADERVPETRPRITLNHKTGKPQYFQNPSEFGHAGERITLTEVLGSSHTRSGLFALTEQYDYGQLYIPPLDFNTDVPVPVLRAAARICARRHAVLIADSPSAWNSVAEVAESIDRFSLRGPNVALFYPWLENSESRVSGSPKCLPPGGAVAGALAHSALSEQPDAAPASHRMILRGFRKFSDNVSERACFTLASRGINSLRFSKGGRKVVWDPVLLNTEDSLERNSLRERRIIQYVSRSVEEGLRWVIFEEHSEQLWRRVNAQVSEFLFGCWRRGLLAGSKPSMAFRVRCDVKTNPGVRRQHGELGLTLELAPLVPSRFVELHLITPTASNAQYG